MGLNVAVHQASRGRRSGVASVTRRRLMTRLVRCKEGMLRTKNVNKNAFDKANGTEIIILNTAQLD